jgi:hypothetical protein
MRRFDFLGSYILGSESILMYSCIVYAEARVFIFNFQSECMLHDGEGIGMLKRNHWLSSDKPTEGELLY